METTLVSELTAQDAAAIVRPLLSAKRCRLAFAGRAGAGKTTMCELLASGSTIPIINHADGIKDEVLTWVADCRRRLYIPGEDATFEKFCDFVGISPGLVQNDLRDLLMPVWDAFNQLLQDVYDHRLDVTPYCKQTADIDLATKVAYVDAYKQFFRTSLQLWGQVVKDLGSNPYHWVDATIGRAMTTVPCLNGDTRFKEELERMSATGWTSVYLDISEATQKIRRPDLTEEQRNHISEISIGPEDCDFVINGELSEADVLLQLAGLLTVDQQELVAAQQTTAGNYC